MTAPLDGDADPFEAHDAALDRLQRQLIIMQAGLYWRILLPLWLTFAAAIGAACVVVQIAKGIAR